jgi:dTDP-4-amino-4,6-dideoxygalactose transaminase
LPLRGGRAGALAGRRLGTLGDVGAVSFYPTKNLGALGDAGLLVTDDADVASFARKLRNHGSERRYEHETLGYNSRLDAIQAAALRVKLPHLDDWTRERRRLAARYDDGLAGLPDLLLPPASVEHVYHQYTLRIGSGRRAEVAARLAEHGIATSVHYPTTLERYGGRVHGELTRAHAAAASVLSLPLYPSLGEARQDRVIDALRERPRRLSRRPRAAAHPRGPVAPALARRGAGVVGWGAPSEQRGGDPRTRSGRKKQP